MSDKDIEDILRAGYESGIKKVSWTGGEPTVRKEFIKLVKKAKNLGMAQQSLTTNGILYSKIAEELKKAGITKINFSLDTLSVSEYKKICGYDGFFQVLKSIEKAVELYDEVKINCVITKSNRQVLKRMIKNFEKYDGRVIVRFLEMVPCGQMYEYKKEIFENEFLPISKMIKDMETFGKLTPVQVKGDVPKSLYFKIWGMKGIYGVNPNFSVNFKCDQDKCPKIRVSPHGFVSNCTINLKYVRDFRNKTLKQKIKLMKEIVNEKKKRNYKGFVHKQRYYDFWRFGINPEQINKKFYK